MEKPLDQFRRNSRRKDGRTSECTSCRKTIDAESHQRHREARLIKRRADILAFREWMIELKRKPCADCEISYPPYVMHWDHLPDHLKEFNLGDGKLYSKARVLAEIAKCELVCANCHAERTYQRRLSSTG